MLSLALLAACLGDPPVVSRVVPEAALPGDAIALEGEGFTPAAVVELVDGPRRVPLPTAFLTETRGEAELPADLPPARWTVEVRDEHGAAEVRPVIDVWTPDTEPACVKRYAVSAETSRTLGRIVVERTVEGREPTRRVLLRDQLVRIEHTVTPLAGGAPCSAVWAVETSGARWLLADDDRVDLGRAASSVATALELPLTTPPASRP
jgi:hypothetical protein